MAQNGSIVFYTTLHMGDVAMLARESFRVMGADIALSAWRSRGPDQGWKELRLALARRGPGVEVVDDDDDAEHVGSNVPADRVAALYKPQRSLRLLMGDTTLGPRIYGVINAAIPEAIRGGFTAGEPSIVLGEHDVFESAENEQGHLFGRATFSFRIFGYGTPNDWAAYRNAIFEVPAVQELERQIVAFAGPLNRCVYWNV